MIFFYAMAMIPLLAGIYFWRAHRGVIWWEWVAGSALGFLLAALFHVAAIQAQCRDHEVFSGHVTSATHHPWWQAREEVDDYEEEEYEDSDGNTHTRRVKVGSHYEYHDHPEHWTCEADFGSYSSTVEYEIDRSFFQQIAANFCGGRLRATQPWKPDFHKGDRNDYVADNKTGFVYPTTRWMAFENRVKASPSLYSYSPVPKDAKVFPYPACRNPFASDRLVGTARQTVDPTEWDRLCSRLGPKKKVNLILVGFGDAPSDIAHQQEAAWIGGKKNDLVLCYGGSDPLNPSWSYVFGWTDKSLVKINLQGILLKGGIDSSIIPAVEREVAANYEIKEWRDFSYLQVEPPAWSYWTYLIVAGLAQCGFWWWARNNPFDKDGTHHGGGSPFGGAHAFGDLGGRRWGGRPGLRRFGGGMR